MAPSRAKRLLTSPQSPALTSRRQAVMAPSRASSSAFVIPTVLSSVASSGPMFGRDSIGLGIRERERKIELRVLNLD